MLQKVVAVICFTIFLLVGCSRPGSEEAETVAPLPPTLAPLNTLVPTFTPLPPPHLQITPTPAPNTGQTAVDPTATINFEQVSVSLVYRIPALGLDRQLEGNISGQITVFDNALSFGIQRSNQGNILLDLQRRLPEIELQPLPDGCTACVHFRYSLPLSNESRQGWLQDPVMLASVENYMAALITPHFPPDAVIGLRREATFYYPAHSIALMADGRIYTWFATEGQVDAPFPTPLSFIDILAQLPLDQLKDSYAVNCQPEPVERLRIYTTGQPFDIAIRCPAYALPTTLLPLYLQLDEILAEKLATYSGPERPPTGLPLDALLDYKRLDGNQLTLSQNGRITLQNNSQIIYTGTLTTTALLSLTTSLLDSGQLQAGLTTLLTSNTPQAQATSAPTSLLLVRGPEGILDGKFTAIDLPFLRDLNQLLDSLLAPPEPTPESTPTPDPESTPEAEEPTATPDSS